MRIHGIQLRGLSAPTGDHQLGLDPGYTVLRISDPEAARSALRVARALLHPESARAAGADTQGRALLTLSLRADGCLVAADFARGRVSLGRLDAKGAGQSALSGDAREIEEYLLAVGLPPSDEFDRLHVFGLAPESRGRASSTPIAPVIPPKPRSAPVVRTPPDDTARVQEERARRVAEVEARARALGAERERLTRELEAALAAAGVERERELARIRELRALEDDFERQELVHRATQAELEKNAALAEGVEDFDARLAQFRALALEQDEERAVVEDKRVELLADRTRLRAAPRRQRVPIVLGLALGAAGAAAGAVGYPAGYGLAGAGILTLLVALAATRIARAKLARIETLLAVLRVRERTSERRFASEGAAVRGLMLALGVDSLDALKTAAQGFTDLVERAAAEKRRLAELAERHPAGAREELARLEQTGGDLESRPAVRAAREALAACPTAVVLPEIPPAPAPIELAEDDTPPEADTAVEFPEKPDEEPEPAAPSPGLEVLVEATARVARAQRGRGSRPPGAGPSCLLARALCGDVHQRARERRWRLALARCGARRAGVRFAPRPRARPGPARAPARAARGARRRSARSAARRSRPARARRERPARSRTRVQAPRLRRAGGPIRDRVCTLERARRKDLRAVGDLLTSLARYAHGLRPGSLRATLCVACGRRRPPRDIGPRADVGPRTAPLLASSVVTARRP